MDRDVTFGAWLRRRRRLLDLTQKELARQVGCAVVTIRKFETDDRKPSKDLAERLAVCLKLFPEEYDQFIAFARTEPYLSPQTSAPAPVSPLTVVTPPFLKQGEKLSKTEEHVFVARERELVQLNAFLEAALAGQGRVVFVTGEAGSGKTALVEEFVRQACRQQAGLIVAGGTCNAYGGIGDPYLPFREVLELLTGDVESRYAAGTMSQTQARHLWEMMPHAVGVLVEAAPDLIDTFIPGKALAARAANAASLGADWLAELRALLAEKATAQGPANLQQSDLFAQYAHLLQRLAQSQPLLLVLDDLQWADSGSISLLFHLGRQLQGHSIFIVGIYRRGEVRLGRDGGRHPLQPVVNEFQRFFGNTHVDLTRSEGQCFVEALIDSEPNRLGGDFRQMLYRITKGHALFTVEMLRGMQTRGDLIRDEAGHWTEGETLDWNTLPARVEGVIAERLNRLPPALQEILNVAAVEGETFTAQVMAQVQGVETRPLVRQLSEDLDKQHRLVRSQGGQLMEPNGPRLSWYRFRHILFQRYLYSRLDEVERAYIHEAVGETLEQLYAGQTEQIAVQLVRHFHAAGLVEKAAGYLLQAGHRAVRLSAYEEALAHFDRGLNLLTTLPAGLERDRQELLLQIALGNILIAVKGYGSPEVEQAYTRAWMLCRQAGNSSEFFPVMYGLWVFRYVRAELHLARELGEQFLYLAQHHQASVSLLMAYNVMGTTLLSLGEIIPAQENLEQCLALHNRQQHNALAFIYGQDPEIAGLSHLALSLWLLGYPDQALEMSHRSLDIARNVSHPYSQAFALTWAAIFYQFRRDERATKKQVEALLKLSDKLGFVVWSAVGTVLQGWISAELGYGQRGKTQILRAVTIFQDVGTAIFQSYVLALLAETYGKVGEAGKGLTVLAEALAVVHRLGERFYEAEIHRLKGELLLKDEGGRQKDEQAEECFLKAIEIARRQEAKSLELRAVMSLCRLWQQQGKKEDACRMLAEIYDWFIEGFDTVDLQEAKTLLGTLSEPEGYTNKKLP